MMVANNGIFSGLVALMLSQPFMNFSCFCQLSLRFMGKCAWNEICPAYFQKGAA